MGKIAEAIEAAKGGDLVPLIDCARNLPQGEPTTDFDQDGVPPTNEEGEGFNTITAAFFDGDLTEAQYKAVMKVAEMGREHSAEVTELKPSVTF